MVRKASKKYKPIPKRYAAKRPAKKAKKVDHTARNARNYIQYYLEQKGAQNEDE